MSNEIHINCASGNTIYAVIRNTAGQVWNPLADTFEDWGTNGHNADDYDLALTDKGGSRYVASFCRSLHNSGVFAGWWQSGRW
jgi:hypothetical protein